MADQNETTEAPLVVCVGPNSIMVGRGGQPTPSFSQIVPRVDEALLGRWRSAGTYGSSSGAGGAGGGGAGAGNSAAAEHSTAAAHRNHQVVRQWHWPPHVQSLAADELLIVVFPTDWPRELRVALARSVFEDLKAASAVFVCSAVAVGYAVGMGLDGDDAHAALYGDMLTGKKRKASHHKRNDSDDSASSSSSDDSSSDDDSDDDESSDEDGSSSSGDSSDEDDAHKKKGNSSKKAPAPTTSAKGKASALKGAADKSVASAPAKPKNGGDDVDNDNARGGLQQLAPTAAKSTMPVRTPRNTTKFCVIELQYDRLTCAFVENGAVSRFVSVPRLPSAAVDAYGTLLTLRDAATKAATDSTAAPFILPLETKLALCSVQHNGVIPSTVAKLEKKIATDIQQEWEASGPLFVDFQLALCLSGEAATITGMREALGELFPCDSVSPDDNTNHRFLLPNIAPTWMGPISAVGNTNASATIAAAANPSSAQSVAVPINTAITNSNKPYFVGDLSYFMGASMLSTVPDKVLEKVSVTRELYMAKGGDVVLVRSAL